MCLNIKSFYKTAIQYALCVTLLLSSEVVFGQVRVHFINVGYGDAILIEAGDEQNIMIDTGRAATAAALVDYLHKRNIHQLKYLILTHAHENHTGGFALLNENIPIQNKWDHLFAMEKKSLIIGEVTLEFLHPDPDKLTGNLNYDSLVTLLKHGSQIFLLTSDIGPKQQNDLLTANPHISAAAVVQVPHHGDTLNNDFHSAFDQPYWVMSTGKNPYDLPDETQFEFINGQLLRTDKHGTIVFHSKANTLTVKEENE